jgi:hypothetical protein
MEKIRIISKKEIPSMRRKINALARASYPDFVLWENATLRYWDKIYSDFIDYQIFFARGKNWRQSSIPSLFLCRTKLSRSPTRDGIGLWPPAVISTMEKSNQTHS